LTPNPTSDADPAGSGFARIDGLYTHFNKIEIVKDARGDYWADRSWAKDIALHRRYIPGFRMCAPVRHGVPPTDWINLCSASPLMVFEQRPDSSWFAVLANLVPNALTALQATRGSDIIQSEGAGWAAPNTFLLTLLRPFLKSKRVIVIESMFWRVEKGAASGMRRRIEHILHDWFLRRAVAAADVRIFTHAGYRDYFLSPDAHALINPASWIDGGDVIDAEFLRARHKSRAAGPLRALFAARWIPEKGVATLKSAIELLAAENQSLEVTFMGEGPLAEEIHSLAATPRGAVTVRIAPPASYGRAFFDAIGAYDVMLVPTLSSEQPRVIFDAFSQGVPVIASATPGNLSIVDAETALTFPPGEAHALAKSLIEAARDLNRIQAMGERALHHAAAATHEAMHRVRSHYVAQRLYGDLSAQDQARKRATTSL
jgi:glycosyltransferase involved in cell wall biosynthesis